MDRRTIAHFAAFGFVILRRAFDPEPLAGELDAALATGVKGRTAPLTSDEASIRFHYLPMMCERTPISLDLVDRFATVAEAIIERPVLPVRAKGTRYLGNAGWHRDTEHDITSLGFACYLEPLTAESGALRLLPGSHRLRSLTPWPGCSTATPTLQAGPQVSALSSCPASLRRQFPAT